jgi:hypothetical protein
MTGRTYAAPVKTAPMTPPAGDHTVTRMGLVVAALAAGSAATGALADGGGGRRVVETTRGATATLHGEGLYANDTWLVGIGSRGQDVAVLLVELPILLLVLRWHRSGSQVAASVLAGVLAFFTYLYTSMTFASAQNRLFPLYVATAAVAGFALLRVASSLDVRAVADSLPDRPSRRTLKIYLGAVAAALTLAWLPEMIALSLGGDIAEAVGPYTSQVTHALDLGVVVPVVLLAVVLLHRLEPAGSALALVMLVVNVCIGVLLMAQGVAQLAAGVPMTFGEIAVKMLTFAALTLVAGGLLMRMALRARHPTEQAATMPGVGARSWS